MTPNSVETQNQNDKSPSREDRKFHRHHTPLIPTAFCQTFVRKFIWSWSEIKVVQTHFENMNCFESWVIVQQLYFESGQSDLATYCSGQHCWHNREWLTQVIYSTESYCNFNGHHHLFLFLSRRTHCMMLCVCWKYHCTRLKGIPGSARPVSSCLGNLSMFPVFKTLYLRIRLPALCHLRKRETRVEKTLRGEESLFD